MPLSIETSNEVVRYTTKELLAEIRDGISVIKATQSAYEARLLRIEATVAEHQKLAEIYPDRIDSLAKDFNVREQVAAALAQRKDKGFTHREKLLAATVSIVLVFLNVLSLVPGLIR